MLMTKVRAQSYVRRTISQPISRRRQSTCRPCEQDEQQGGLTTNNAYSVSASAPQRNLHLKLLADNIENYKSNIENSYKSNLENYKSNSQFEPIREEDSELDEDELRYSFTLYEDFLGVSDILLTYINILLIFVPLGIISMYYKWTIIYVFLLNFLALLPLAALLGSATEELALYTGEITGGLLNATLGNAIEVILSIQALKKGMVTVVQGTLLGSILSNLLLVLGLSFFLGGIKYHIQRFNAKGATCNTSLLLLSTMGIAVPTVGSVDSSNPAHQILMISRITALLIASTYVMFLFFQLYTHIGLFYDDGTDGQEWPRVSWVAALVILVGTTLLVSVHSEYLVDSINPVVESYGVPQEFIGVIVLPIVGNAAEHFTAVTVALKDKVDLTMGVAVGSSAQIALFVVPFTVLMGWCMDVPMTLAFSPLSAIILLLAILVVLGVVQDGESNWLEGVMLIIAYLIVAVTYWYKDNKD